MVELSTEDLRAVTRYAVACAADVLHLFERAAPDDPRPGAAIDAAQAFAGGLARSRLQRVTALDANRAAREVRDPVAQHAARAAGAAGAAAYLHPLTKATQVGHILGAAAHAARAWELAAGDVPDVSAARIEDAARRAGSDVVDVLRRYPPAPSRGNRVTQLMSALDTRLRGVD